MTILCRFFAILLSCTSLLVVEGFADWFTKDYCSRKLFVGQVIMNNKAVASEERFVRVFRGTKELTSGDVYHPAESLSVSINDAKNQYVYEVSEGGAKFEKGGCEGRRIADKPKVTLVMPAKGAATASEFEIILGWATGHEAVNISPAFRLVSAESMTHHDTPKVVANDVKSKSKLNKLSGKSRKKLDEEKEEEQNAVNALFEHENKKKGDKEQILFEEEEGEHKHETILEANQHADNHEEEEEEHGDLHHRHLPHDSQDHHHSESLSHEELKLHASNERDELDHAPKHAPEVEVEEQHQLEQRRREDDEHRTIDHHAHDHSGGMDAEGIPPPVIPKKEKAIHGSASSHELEELHSLADHIHHLDEQHNHVQGQGQGTGHVENGHHEEEHGQHRSNHVDHMDEAHGQAPESLSSIFHRERAEEVHEHDQHVNAHDHNEHMPVHGRPSELHDNHNHEHHDNNHHLDHHEEHHPEDILDHHQHDNNYHHDLKIQHERENDFQGFHEEDHHHGDMEHPLHDLHHDHEHEMIHHDHEHFEEHNRDHPQLPGATGREGAFPDPHHHLDFGLGNHPSPFKHVQDHFNRLHDQLQGDHMIQPPPPHHELMGQIHAEAVRQHEEQLMVIPSEEDHEGHDKEDIGLAQEGQDGDEKDGSHSDHINPHHHTTDQFHHKFGVPGKEEEFHEKHHKYTVGKVAGGSSTTPKGVINALGAKAAATMKTMTKLRGGPRASARGHGLGYVTLWEWLGLAAVAMLIFGVSRVVANRHKLKRYVLRKQGYDLDK